VPINVRPSLTAAHPFRSTIEAAEHALDAEHDFLEGKVGSSRGTWQMVTTLLVARALQLQRVAIDGAILGYDEEIRPVARAMMSTVVTLTAIAHGTHAEQERKAVRYLTFGRKARRAQLRYLAQSHWIDAAQRRALDADATAEEDRFLASAKAAGVIPLRMGKQERYWSGYSDAELFKRMGLKRWYSHYYAPWSDESHGGAASLVRVSDQLEKLGRFEIGPHHSSPWFVLLGASEFGLQTIVQVNKLYRLGQRATLRDLWLRTQREFSAAAASS